MCFLFGRTCPCTTLHPRNLSAQYALAFTFSGTLYFFAFRFPFNKTGVITIIVIQAALINFHYAVCHTVKKIAVMCNHYKPATVISKVFLKPFCHCAVEMVSRLIKYKYICWCKKSTYKGNPFPLPARKI